MGPNGPATPAAHVAGSAAAATLQSPFDGLFETAPAAPVRNGSSAPAVKQQPLPSATAPVPVKQQQQPSNGAPTHVQPAAQDPQRLFAAIKEQQQHQQQQQQQQPASAPAPSPAPQRPAPSPQQRTTPAPAPTPSPAALAAQRSQVIAAAAAPLSPAQIQALLLHQQQIQQIQQQQRAASGIAVKLPAPAAASAPVATSGAIPLAAVPMATQAQGAVAPAAAGGTSSKPGTPASSSSRVQTTSLHSMPVAAAFVPQAAAAAPAAGTPAPATRPDMVMAGSPFMRSPHIGQGMLYQNTTASPVARQGSIGMPPRPIMRATTQTPPARSTRPATSTPPTLYQPLSHPAMPPVPQGPVVGVKRDTDEFYRMYETKRRFKAALEIDQQAITQPNMKRPFRDMEDVLERLMPYHLYTYPETSERPELVARTADLIDKKAREFMKYEQRVRRRVLDARQKMAKAQHMTERVMLETMLCHDERMENVQLTQQIEATRAAIRAAQAAPRPPPPPVATPSVPRIVIGGSSSRPSIYIPASVVQQSLPRTQPAAAPPPVQRQNSAADTSALDIAAISSFLSLENLDN